MTTSFPSDERSPPHTRKQQKTKVQHEASDSKKVDSSETKQEQVSMEESLAELKAEVQKSLKEEKKNAGLNYQLVLRSQNRQGLAELEYEYEDLLDTHKLLKESANKTVFYLVNKLLLEPMDSHEIKKFHQVIPVMRSLLDNFEKQGMIAQPRIDLPGRGSLDLLLRFTHPPKVTFGTALRSQGDSTIVYNERKEALHIRRNKGRGGLYPWKPDQIDQLGEQEFWLRKNFRSIFGESARDKNRPMVKLLVLTDDTKLGNHSDHLYETIGDQRVLLIKKRCSVYVMEEKQLIPMIRAWLAHK